MKLTKQGRFAQGGWLTSACDPRAVSLKSVSWPSSRGRVIIMGSASGLAQFIFQNTLCFGRLPGKAHKLPTPLNCNPLKSVKTAGVGIKRGAESFGAGSAARPTGGEDHAARSKAAPRFGPPPRARACRSRRPNGSAAALMGSLCHWALRGLTAALRLPLRLCFMWTGGDLDETL